MWNVFFLVPVGRGQLDDLLSGEEFEQVFGKIYELSQRVSFQIKTTEAMHYRRYLLQHNLEERKISHGHGHPGGHPGVTKRIISPAHTGRLRARHANRRRRIPHCTPGSPAASITMAADLFISHTGNVYPSGFLPKTNLTSL